MKYSTIIFDMDGTLLYTDSAVEKAFEKTMIEFHIPIKNLKLVHEVIGADLNSIIHHVLPSNYNDSTMLSSFQQSLLAHYNQNLWKSTIYPFDGIPSLLNELKRRNLTLSVLSNSPDTITKELINLYFPSTFHIVQGESALFTKKPNPAGVLTILDQTNTPPEQALIIGDSLTDYETACNANIDMIGAGWAKSTVVEKLSQTIPSLVVDKPLDILNIIEDKHC